MISSTKLQGALAFFIFFGVSLAHPFDEQSPNFRLHLNQEPQNLDPQVQKSAVTSYLLQSLHRNLLWFDNEKGLIPDLAEKCFRKKSRVICQIHKQSRWSDGSPITAQDFLQTYKFILKDPQGYDKAHELFSIQNAKEIFEGKKSIDELGVKATRPDLLEFNLTEPNSEFEFTLSQTALSPRPSKEKIFSGPYQLKEWISAQKILLVKNPGYRLGNPNRPAAEFYFIPDDSIALKMYEKNELDFLRRLPTSQFNQWKDKKDFLKPEVLRFDYYGFGPDLPKKELRIALQKNLNYSDLKKIFQAEGKPGCFALPEDFYSSSKPDQFCITFEPHGKKSELQWPSPLTITYSTQGGDDHRRLAEWMQSEWKKNLGLNFQIIPKENKVFLADLKQNPSSVYRKGLTLKRPTCLAALENFTKGHPENYLNFFHADFEALVKNLRKSDSPNKRKKLCTQGLKMLQESHLFIPAGRFYFFMLLNQKFKGVSLNLMNQLDLSQLH